MKSLPHENALFNSAELAKVIGADLDTIKNWVRRGFISRAPLGGRHMANRLFSAEEVYKTAVKYELVKLGLPPSLATEAVNSIWRQVKRNDVPEKQEIYAVLVPVDDKWSSVLCWRSEPSGAFYKFTRQVAPEREKMPLPDRAFAIVPITGTLTRIAERLDSLLERTKKPRLEN